MKLGFQQHTIAVRSGDGQNFMLLEDLVYVRGDGKVITIPKGTTTDGASTPAVLWSMIPPFGLGWKSYILHDHAYRNTWFSKQECDDLIKEAMLSEGVDPVTVELVYRGVRLGGQPSFDEDRTLLAQISPPPADYSP